MEVAPLAHPVEVMIPAIGDRPMLRDAIASVFEQDDPHWLLTVVDDGASVGDGMLASWLADLGDSRVRYLANRNRLGINRNFQRCADESRADWVMVLGDDDRLLPDCISRIRRIVDERPRSSWIHTGATIIDDTGRPARPMADRVKRRSMPRIDNMREMAGEELAISLLIGNWMYFPSCAFRRDVLQSKGFRSGYDVVLDLDLFLRILLDGGSCVLLEHPGIEYRRHRASVSSSGAADGSRFDEEVAFFRQTAEVMTKAGWPRAASAARKHWTSRLHALAKVPSAVATGNPRAAGALIRIAASTDRQPRGRE